MNAVSYILGAGAGTPLLAAPDLCVLNDDLSHALPELAGGVAPALRERTLVVLDHDIPAGSFDTAFRQKALIDLSRRYGLPFVQAEGVGYALLCERRLKSGQLFLGWGDHACAVGAVGALGLQLTDGELGMVLETGEYALNAPEVAGLRLTGALGAGVTPYDAALSLLPAPAARRRGRVLLLVDETAQGLPVEARMTLCQMLHRFGALSALFLPRVEAEALLDGGASETCDLSLAAPCVARPGGVTHIQPLADLEAVKVDACFIGGCCGGQLGDLRRAAAVLRGKRIRRELRLTVGFASNAVYLQAMREGLVDVFLDCGAQVTNPGCSSCRTTSIGVVGDGEALASTGCYNDPGCCGTPASQVWLAGAETVARAALSGYIQLEEGAAHGA